jgi:hypothetical protein
MSDEHPPSRLTLCKVKVSRSVVNDPAQAFKGVEKIICRNINYSAWEEANAYSTRPRGDRLPSTYAGGRATDAEDALGNPAIMIPMKEDRPFSARRRRCHRCAVSRCFRSDSVTESYILLGECSDRLSHCG